MWYWIVLEQSANLVEAVMLVVLLQQFLKPKSKRFWIPVLSIAGIFAIINLLNFVKAPIVLNFVLYYGIGVLLAFAMHRGGVAPRLLVPLLMVTFVMIPELLTMGLLIVLFHADESQFLTDTVYRMLGIIISKVMLIMLVYIAGRLSRREDNKIPALYSVSLLLVPLISIVCMITIMQFIKNPTQSTINPVWLMLSALGLLFVNLLIIFLFEAFTKYANTQNQLQLMTQQTEMLSNHLREINTVQEETHRIWHDMKNHFTVIHWMVQSQSYDKLDQYMATLNQSVMNTMLQVQSGNLMLDALLNPKVAEAKKNGIEVIVNACVPSNLPIDDIDLNIVFSNALDNAMDACKKLPEGQPRFIDVDTYIKNDHLVIRVRNSFDGTLRQSGEVLLTTKEEPGRHGIGMGNMRNAVNKYDGHILSNVEGNVFILSAIMFCKIRSKVAG